MGYLNRLIDYMSEKMHKWREEITELVDSPQFEFLELKPLFPEPTELVHYVTRCKLLVFIRILSPLVCAHGLRDHMPGKFDHLPPIQGPQRAGARLPCKIGLCWHQLHDRWQQHTPSLLFILLPGAAL